LLHDKGKPVVKRGRKARGLPRKVAQLPNGGCQLLRISSRRVVALVLMAALIWFPGTLPALAADGFRAFSSDSYWNTPLPAEAPIDPRSAAFIDFLNADNDADYLRIVGADSSGGWGEPIFWAQSSDPVYKVKQTRYTLPEQFAEGVRIPKEARPPDTSDAQMTIYDLAAGSVYKLQKAVYDSDTDTWSAGGGSWYATESNGLHRSLEESNDERNHGHRGIPPATHAVRFDEIEAGRIDHALKIAVNTAHQDAVWPMTNSDGDSNDPAALPQGARLRIKPSVDLDELDLSPAALVIARALQRYGAVVGDSSGSNTNLKVENTVVEGRGWMWKDVLTAASLEAIPFGSYEVVRLGYSPPPSSGEEAAPSEPRETEPPPSRPGSVTRRFGPVADATVDSARPEANFGRRRRLRVTAGPRARSLLKFRVSTTSDVETATLRVFARRPSRGIRVAFTRRVSWRERAVTWRSAPKSMDVFGSRKAGGRGTWISFDVTTAIGGSGDYGFVLLSSSGRGQFASSEARRARAPRLVVETR
jgi:hypothetical protein